MEELRIKDILKQKGFTIIELSKKLGINRVTLSNIMSGNPTLETLNKIASALDCNVRDFFKDNDKPVVNGFLELENGIVKKINSFEDLEELYKTLKSR